MDNKDLNAVVFDFKQKLINAINECELPGVLVYEILNGLTLQIQNQLQTETRKEQKEI